MSCHFNLLSTPLNTGNLLIEASAGTGKTYSLTGIILRLIIEHEIPIEEILVVTFTEAATAELKGRTRAALIAIMDALEFSDSKKDPLAHAVLAQTANDPAARAQILDRLKEALSQFDAVQISTIHGFCSAVLTENAFESAMLFDSEVLTDEAELRAQVCNDFLRKCVTDCSDTNIFRILANANLLKRDALMKRLADAAKATCTEAYIRANIGSNNLPPDNMAEPLDAAAQRWQELAHALQQAVAEDKSTLVELFTHPAHLSGTNYRQNRKDAILHMMDSLAGDPLGAIDDYLRGDEAFKFFSKDNVERALKKNAVIDVDREALRIGNSIGIFLATLPEDLGTAFDSWALAELERLKRERNVITFQDMLNRTLEALIRSPLLLAAMQQRYSVALIDEFQDTDSVQLAIFRTIFDTAGKRLYCVGDPKQSIYAFRGADIQTYLEVSNSGTFEKQLLATNYRSDHAVVMGVNHLFTAPGHEPFEAGIPFHPSVVPEEKRIANPPVPPAFLLRDLTGQASDAQIANAAVAEILQIQAHTGRFSSIAVLVNSHTQARTIANACRARGIPYIRKIEQSVYSTDSAILMLIALSGILHLGRIKKLKTALATPLMGWSIADVLRMDSDDELLNEEMERMHTLRQLWRDCGIMTMLQALMESRQTRERLLVQPGGEESLSNLLHLGELLHENERRNHATPEETVAFLSEQISNGSAEGNDASKIRLSTDADAVVFSTIHRSKGLEYENVIVPFAWRCGKDRTNEKTEGMRKLYVAVTRAKHGCSVYVADGSTTHETALGSLLGIADKKADVSAAVQAIAENSEGWIGYCRGPATAPATLALPPSQPLQVPQPPRSLPPAHIISSFSGFKHAAAHHKPAPEEVAEPPSLQSDEQDTEEEAILPPADTLPRGTKFGVAIHAVLENIDFTRPEESLDEQLRQQLSKEGLGNPAFIEQLRPRFLQWLQTPLLPEDALSLNTIDRSARLDELEFHFSLNGIAKGDIANAIGPENWPELEQAIHALHGLPGYMKGFIDLVFQHGGKFYIADWKTNYLGDGAQAYHPDALRQSMLEHLYPLQYLIYTVALDRYLAHRLTTYSYETHFGGIFYVYLRGFGHASGHSVFHTRPQQQTIRNLSSLLIRSPR